MKSKFLIGSVAVMAVGTIAWAAKDPVVMTINGEDVPRSEFEYLFRKNSQQQIEAQPLEEYVGMFELYKMKVAEAKAEGIDTTAAFISEMKTYRRDLANPYVADSIYLNKLIDEAYNNSLEELDYYHIMLPKGRTASENAIYVQRADSIHTALLNGADFEELAKKYSSDRTATTNGGHLGYIASGRLPYSFEHTAYSLKPGEISEVVESSAGYHILKGGGRRPARGSVRAAHIMKRIPAGASPEMEASIKAEIDSIYKLVSANPQTFETLAMSNSDDQGSARMGGQIGWFVAGMMVPEFSERAFDMEVGEISEPVRTQYGWHIIRKLDAHGVRSREEIKPELLAQFNDQRDERFKMIRDNRDQKLGKKHKLKVNDASLKSLRQYVGANGLDSTFYRNYGSSNNVIYTIDGVATPVSELVAVFNNTIMPDPYVGGMIFDEQYATALDNALLSAEENWLYANNADYRNLLNEYRDGSLLYEVSNKRVWEKAANDTPGLERFFAEHRDDYKFKEPRAKGILILAKNDSVADLVKARYAEINKDSAIQILRNEFHQDIVADRLLAPQGLNRFVDKVLFNGPDPELNPRYPVYFILDARVITEPEEMSDVKGAVTSDYQQELDQNWTTELRQKYPVVRNDKELMKIKP